MSEKRMKEGRKRANTPVIKVTGVGGHLDEKLSIKQSDIIQPQRPPIVLAKPH